MKDSEGANVKISRILISPLKSYKVQSKPWFCCEKQNGNKKLDVKKITKQHEEQCKMTIFNLKCQRNSE